MLNNSSRQCEFEPKKEDQQIQSRKTSSQVKTSAASKALDLRNQVAAMGVLPLHELPSKLLFHFTFLFLFALSVLTTGIAHAEMKSANSMQADLSKHDASKQDAGAVKASIVEFLTTQSAGYPGTVSVSAGAVDPNLKLTACSSIRVFLPPGSRAWGKTSVGVRCDAPANWTIYVQALVSVSAKYLVAATPLAQGHVVNMDDLMFENGELTQLPAGIFTDMTQAVGRSVSVSIGAGTVLRQEMLKLPPVVQQGQTVMVTSIGNGFSVSAEGRALTNANEGQVVQVKVASGQVLSGIARNGGQIQIGY